MNYTSGDQVAKAIDKRIISIAKQVTNKSPVNRTVYGRIVSQTQGGFSISVNNTIYNNIPVLKYLNYLKIGDRVICLVPNNQFNDMIILGVVDNSITNNDRVFTKNDLLNVIYPINSVYMNSIDSNPSGFLGGVWQSLGTFQNPLVYVWVRIS